MQAKRFLVSRIVDEARRQHEPLSDLEEKMPYFSESYTTLPHMMEIAERFEREVDSANYEAKVSRIAKSAYREDVQESPANVPMWKEAVTILNAEDHYILVMLGFLVSGFHVPGVAANKDQWRLLGYGLLTAFLMALVIIPLFKLKVPQWCGELMLAAIGIGVFWLSRYMKRRTK